MPYYRLVDRETRKFVSVRRMSHEVAALLNSELGDDQQWKQGFAEFTPAPILPRGVPPAGLPCRLLSVLCPVDIRASGGPGAL